jgi:hypothetical protein
MRLVLVLAAIASGCTQPAYPVTHAGPTGERVAVVDDVVRWITTERVQVGQTEIKDSSTGETVATAAIYEDRTHEHAANIWYPVQGSYRLSDEDFFQITGDPTARDATERLRARGRRWKYAGIVGVIVGVAAVSASAWLPNASTLVRTSVAGAAAVAIPIGLYGMYEGDQLLNPDTHAVDRATADADAARYDARVGHPVGVGFGGSF